MNKEDFFSKKIKEIFENSRTVIDIGGGLRVSPKRSNRYDKSREWLSQYIKKVDYKILDIVSDYHPDIVGDIHNLPFSDNSCDAIICIAVLEHVEDPIRASEEIFRVLKPGGRAYIYVPFLFYYHAKKGYYKDYWRFTGDCIDLLFKKFSVMEKESVRGAIETWIKLSPLGRINFVLWLARKMDIIFHKNKTQQVSAYNIFLVK
ncbi:MAG: methyltransferase domain-containing protein [bacterium]